MAPLEKSKRTVNNLTHEGKPVKPERTPMYKYREQVKQEKQQNKDAHQTMGITKVRVSPDKNLLKHSKEPKLPEKKPFSRTDVQPRKPVRPAPTIQPPAQNHPPKDFMSSNAQRNIKSVPSKPKPECADARYKYREQVKQEKQQNKDAHQTMGITKVRVSPDKNLLKHSKEPKLPEKKPFLQTDVQPRKPARPAPTIQPPAQNHPPKDFIRYNAQRNIKSVPSKPKPECADARYEHTALPKNSVLVPKYSKKKDFGKIPEYMRKEREAKEKAQEYDRQMKEKMNKLAEAEHQKILQDLKTKFNELLNEYNNMPLIICTTSAKQKKLFLEKQMDQLEKDIKLKEKYLATHISVG